MSLLAIVLELQLSAGVSAMLFWTVVLLASPVHMFAQLRGAYSLSVFPALRRTAFLLAFSTRYAESPSRCAQRIRVA